MVSLREQILKKVRTEPKIPAPPQTIFKVLEMTKDPDCDLGRLSDVISREAGLTAQLLRQANSAIFGFAHPTSSVSAACLRLGLKAVRSGVINQHVVNGLGSARPPSFEAARYWQYAFATSVAACDLAIQVLHGLIEDASTAGLLCDIGIGLLAFCVPQAYQPVLDQWLKRPASQLQTLEQQALGLDHAELAAIMLGDWKLDEHIIESVRLHHLPPGIAMDRDPGPLPRIVSAAVLIARIALDGSDMNWVETLFRHLDGITTNADEVVARLLDDLVSNIQSTAQSMAIELGSIDGIKANLDELSTNLSGAVAEG